MINLLWLLLIPVIVFIVLALGRIPLDAILDRDDEWWSFPALASFGIALFSILTCSITAIVMTAIGG